MTQTLKKHLQKPFEMLEISWLVQRSGRANGGKVWALVAPYIKSDAIEDRLDDSVGPENWKVEKYEPGANGGLQCGLSIRVDGEWVTKWDGADNTNVESIKGGMTDAFKRAARKWGIGRYLKKVKADFAICLEGKRDGAYVSYFKENGKNIYFSFTPPILPDFCHPKPEDREPVDDDKDWTKAETWKQEAESWGEAAKQAEQQERQQGGEEKEQERLQEHIATMIHEMREKKTRLENNRAAFLEISKRFLKANGDIQVLREIEAYAMQLLQAA
jgi:hypothetical protein